MKFVLELSWLWKSIAIIILVIAFCEICALLICKLMKRKLSKKTAIIIAVVATVATGLAIVLLSQTPSLINSNLPKYLANFPNFTGIPACSLVK